MTKVLQVGASEVAVLNSWTCSVCKSFPVYIFQSKMIMMMIMMMLMVMIMLMVLMITISEREVL